MRVSRESPAADTERPILRPKRSKKSAKKFQEKAEPLSGLKREQSKDNERIKVAMDEEKPSTKVRTHYKDAIRCVVVV